jgi:2,4-dienoyl-CoA reductase (NADPH2)
MLRERMIMACHERFSYKSRAELLEVSEKLGFDLPFSDDLSTLFKSQSISLTAVSNRLAVQPMEGYDSRNDGAPNASVFRRYERYARGGSGLIWFEAACVVPEGRSNPHQMMLTERNRGLFRQLIDRIRKAAKKSMGNAHAIFCVLQLTHSGRFSRPDGISRPQCAAFLPGLDKDEAQITVVSDSYLDSLQERFVDSARLAFSAGFDAVDIKACHGYLVNDLLASFTRSNSRYGGEFDNRSRFLVETLQKIRAEIPELKLAVRLGVYDGIPFPYGFGVSKKEGSVPDLEEPLTLIERLVDSGCSLLNITLGNPHYKPHLGRPYDRPVYSSVLADEHPLEGIRRLMKLTGQIQKRFPDTPCVGTGYSWLRQFFPHVGAAALERGEASFIGLGRSSFAYPGAPLDLMDSGGIDPHRVCVACSCCSELARAGLPTGCVVRDKAVYAGEYLELRRKRRLR